MGKIQAHSKAGSMTTLEALERLENAGFSRDQAAAIIAGIDLKHAQLAKKSGPHAVEVDVGVQLEPDRRHSVQAAMNRRTGSVSV